MRPTRYQQLRCCFLPGAAKARGTRPWMATLLLLFLIPVQFALAMHTAFLETNMKVAWAALVDTGGNNSNNNNSSRHATSNSRGRAREIVNTMLADCHGRRSGAWGAECDRALYFDSVLMKIDRSSSSSSADSAANANTVAEEEYQMATLDSPATEIAVVSATQLPFSAFFHEYAVPRRAVVMLSTEGDGLSASGSEKPADVADGRNQRDVVDQSTVQQEEEKEEEMEELRVNERFLSAIQACLPYPADATATVAAAGTVDGPLRACHDSLLKSLPVPLQVSEDFVQRFRGEDVLPVEKHSEVERFASGWQRIHRTRRGAYIPATACPAGTNTMVSVMSGTLEILVFAPADDFPGLKPTFGNAPCSPIAPASTLRGGAKIFYKSDVGDDKNMVDKEDSTAEIDKDTGNENGKEKRRSGLGDSSEKNTMSSMPNARLLLEEVLGLKRSGMNQEELSLPPQYSLDQVGRIDVQEDTTTAGEEEPQKLAAADNAWSDNRGNSCYSSEGLYWPHEPKYCADVWREDTQGNYTATRKHVQEISTGDKLFVPSGGAVSWRAKGGNADEDEAVAVRFCYVDASNFNAVKSQLPLYAAVEAGAKGLLQAFRSPVFDTSMSRKPSTVFAKDFLAGNRHTATAAASGSSMSPSSLAFDRSGGASHEADGDGATGSSGRWERRRLSGTEAAAASGSSSSSDASIISTSSSSTGEAGRKGGRRGRKSFKEWQDDGRWDLKVLGLTLPTLEPPRVTACERTACIVEWTSSFVKQGQDQTKLGFNLSFVPAVTPNASINAGDGGGGYMEVYVGDSRLKSEHALDRDLLSLGITEGKRHMVVVDTNLAPNTPYRFSVGVVYGETVGPFSEFSPPARTSMVTAPLAVPSVPKGSPGAHAVTLHFPRPHDDGGSPILWYHVMSRPTGENILNRWQAVGMEAAPAPRVNVSVYDTEPQPVEVKVEHLLPGVAYQFRVCAQNDIGTSPWSAPSEPVVVLAASADDNTNRRDISMSGFHPGHQHLRLPNVTDASVSYAGEMEPPPGAGFDPFEREVHGPTVVLDDQAGKIRLGNKTSALEDIDVWTCHYSPKSFKVKAEAVMAQPADARGELENGRFARNRLVVVERGGIPIVHKVLRAQRAGALGVIVADDGRCGSSFGQMCVHGSDPPEGWAALDMPRPWLDVRVPVVLMLREDVERLTAAIGAAAEEAESMAWSSLYDGWLNSLSSSSSSTTTSSVGGGDWMTSSML